MQSGSSLFILGIAIGLMLAVAGGLFDYWLSTRNDDPKQLRQLPGCILFITGSLGLMGIVALVISFILKGTIGPAFRLGAGILSGFYAGFTLLIVLYLLLHRFWPR